MMSDAPREPILYAAPGAGLGHLTRACAIVQQLALQGVAARVVTHSPFAPAMTRLTRCAIDHIPRARWRADLADYARLHAPRLLLLDTFPRGVDHEWDQWRAPSGTRLALVARHLNTKAYAEAAGPAWDTPLARLDRVLAAEPLGPDLDAMFERWGVETTRLPGRVRLADAPGAPPPPTPLVQMLKASPTWLIVHSGPEPEARKLIEIARADMARHASFAAASPPPLAILSPWPMADYGAVPRFDYYPASRLYPLAHRVVTGAGYNSLADAAPYPDKHLPHAFPRKYDNQQARLDAPQPEPINSAPEAASVIRSWL